MAHTVTVTRAFETPGADRDDAEYTLDGTCNQFCESYRVCQKDWHRHPSEEYGDREGHWATKRVPEVHTFVQGEWMLPEVGQCGFTHAGEHDNPEWQMTSVGTYDVDVDWDGDCFSARLALRTTPTEGATP